MRFLITAGPTHEPIDAVRYLGNRSSGRLGIALAEAAQRAGHEVTLLLGPTALEPERVLGIALERFETTSELEALLGRTWPGHDILIMAAAVADYRPVTPQSGDKIERQPTFRLELVATPDLLAALDERTRADQTRIGFALERRDRMEARGREKLARKRLEAIVANPLETIDAPEIEGVLLLADGTSRRPPWTEGSADKARFAAWLVDEASRLHALRLHSRRARAQQ